MHRHVRSESGSAGGGPSGAPADAWGAAGRSSPLPRPRRRRLRRRRAGGVRVAASAPPSGAAGRSSLRSPDSVDGASDAAGLDAAGRGAGSLAAPESPGAPPPLEAPGPVGASGAPAVPRRRGPEPAAAASPSGSRPNRTTDRGSTSRCRESRRHREPAVRSRCRGASGTSTGPASARCRPAGMCGTGRCWRSRACRGKTEGKASDPPAGAARNRFPGSLRRYDYSSTNVEPNPGRPLFTVGASDIQSFPIQKRA